MRIAIVVYSETGHTFRFAEELYLRLRPIHHTALIRLERSLTHPMQLQQMPNLEGFDRVIFGFPVQGFAVPDILVDYLSCVFLKKNAEIACFTTQYFPWNCLGGNQANRHFWQLLAHQSIHPLTTHVLSIHRQHKKKHEQEARVLEILM